MGARPEDSIDRSNPFLDLVNEPLCRWRLASDHHPTWRSDRTSSTTMRPLVSAISMSAQQLSKQSRDSWTSRDCGVVTAAMGQLMDTLAEALARDASSVPRSVAEAALRLSRRVNHVPPPSYDPKVRSRDNTNDAAHPTTRRTHFTESIELGRMG